MKFLNKKFIVLIVFIIASFVGVYANSSSTSKTLYSGKVIATVLNVRDGASESYNIIGKINKNDSVEIYEKESGWYKIKFKSKIGYVNAGFINSNMPQSNSNTSNGTIKNKPAIVNTMALNLRSGPNTSYAKVTTLHRNDLVTIIETKNSWSKIQFNGKTGWATSLYLIAKATPVINKTIVLDAGHGGYDSGAIGPKKTRECDVNLAVTLKLGNILKSQGYNVVYTRKSDIVPWKADKNVELQTRINISDKAKSDLFISVHSNSSDNSSAHGLETYYYNENSKDLAQSIQDGVLSKIKLKDRSVRTAPYYVLRKNKTTSVLVELGYISNANEESMLNDSTYQQKWANGIANGINDYLKK